MNKEEMKEAMRSFFTGSTIGVKFLDIKDVDGTILRVSSEELVIGEVLLVVSEDGESEAGEAEYTLEDGRTIKTDAESKIIEIGEVEVEEEEAELSDETIDLETRVLTLEQLVKELVELSSDLDEKVKFLETTQGKIQDDVAEFSKTPVDGDIDLKSLKNAEHKAERMTKYEDNKKRLRFFSGK